MRCSYLYHLECPHLGHCVSCSCTRASDQTRAEAQLASLFAARGASATLFSGTRRQGFGLEFRFASLSGTIFPLARHRETLTPSNCLPMSFHHDSPAIGRDTPRCSTMLHDSETRGSGYRGPDASGWRLLPTVYWTPSSHLLHPFCRTRRIESLWPDASPSPYFALQ